jgi:hypothetical protein
MALAITGVGGNSGIVQRGGAGLDPDAAAYILAVQAADGQALEPALVTAYNQFFIGCKADASPFAGVSNFDAIKASCIMAGARTLSGALVPLKGPAPTNIGFVAGDYNRSTGLQGNGVVGSKYLDSNYGNNADPQDSRHAACFATIPDNAVRILIGFRGAGTGVELRHNGQNYFNSTPVLTNTLPPLNTPTFIGLSRQSSANYTYRANGVSTSNSASSVLQPAGNVLIFTRTDLAIPSNGRIAFYSLGAAVDLAALQARVQTLRGAISAGLA